MTKSLRGLSAATFLVWCAAAPPLAAQPAATHYDAVTDRGARPKSALPAPGMAGSSLVDPGFGTRLWRITDRSTRSGWRRTGSRGRTRVTIGALPAGLVLHPRTGALGGAPRQAGTFTFTVTAGGASRTFTLVVR